MILKNMCVPRATVYAVTSDISKERRLQIFTDSFCSSANAPRLVVTTYVSHERGGVCLLVLYGGRESLISPSILFIQV